MPVWHYFTKERRKKGCGAFKEALRIDPGYVTAKKNL